MFGNRLPLIFGLSVSALLISSAVARPQDSQSQSSSVAEAARRAKAQKKKSDKASKVITDENFPAPAQPGRDAVNVGGQPDAASQENAPTAAADQAAPKEADQAAAEEDAQIAELKKQLAEAEKELDLQKREFVLDNEAYYSKPDFSNDKAGKAKLDSEQQAIKDQQQQIDRLKARLAPLLERQSRRKPKSATPPAGQSSDKPTATPNQP